MNIRTDVTFDCNEDKSTLLSELSITKSSKIAGSLPTFPEAEKIFRQHKEEIYHDLYNVQRQHLARLLPRMREFHNSLEVEWPDLAEELTIYIEALLQLRSSLRVPQ